MAKRELPLRMTDAEYGVFEDEAGEIGVAPLTYIRWILGLSIEPDAYTALPPDIPDKYKEPRHVAGKAKLAGKATPEKAGKRSE